MKPDDKEMLAQTLEVIAEDIRRLPDRPMDIQIDVITKNILEDFLVPLVGFKQK